MNDITSRHITWTAGDRLVCLSPVGFPDPYSLQTTPGIPWILRHCATGTQGRSRPETQHLVHNLLLQKN